jgi:hypothetical protein
MGRTAIFEYLPVGAGIRRKISERADAEQILEAALSRGLVTLRQNGWEKVRLGVTTPSEVLKRHSGAIDMPSFIYKATDAGGKVVSGTMEAPLEKDVVARLHGMNLIPIRVAASRGSGASLGLNRSIDVSSLFKRVTSRDVMYFTQDLCALLDAGLPMDKALNILIHVSENDRFRQIVTGILRYVESGNSLSDALAEYPKHFSTLYVNMVKSR